MVYPKVREIRGGALLELALTLPIILLLIAAIFTLGRIIWQYQLLTDAAKYGARGAAIDSEVSNGLTCGQLLTRAQYLANRYVAENDTWGLGTQWLEAVANVNHTTSLPELDEYRYEPAMPKGLRVRMITVAFSIKEDIDNCFFCYGSFLRKITVSTSAFMDLHYNSTCVRDEW